MTKAKRADWSHAIADRVHRALVDAGCEARLLDDAEVTRWQNAWRAIYAKQLHASTGAWLLHEYDWHVFSYGHCAAVAGDEARNKYRGIEPCEFLALSSYEDYRFGFACTGKPPVRWYGNPDLVITPTSLAWTMTFTHEVQFGPYFAQVA